MTKVDQTGAEVQPAPVRLRAPLPRRGRPCSRPGALPITSRDGSVPPGYSVPEAKVEMRVGGPFEVCMRSPEGVDHWTRGTFTEVSPPGRLAIDHHVIDPCGGGPLFSACTQVNFSDDASGGT